jgi:dTDP-4-amino-4,6-dideoxygalactose transaminase
MAVKLFKPFVSYRAIINVIRVLLSDQLAEGPEVKKFEIEFAKKFNLRNVVAVNSGTTALDLAYELAHIQPGDEVITPVLTCTATNIPLLHKGAKIVFADIDYDLNINIDDVKNKITDKTKAIVFVHFGGNNRGLSDLVSICRERNITLIEDAAQAVGSDYWGKADFTAVSLQAIKTLTSGDGGFLVCKRDADYQTAKRLRWFGYDRDEKQKKGDTDLVEAGYKYHMNDITAAIGRGNLKSFDKLMKKRKKIQKFYNNDWPYVKCHNWLCIQEIYDVREQGGNQHHYRNDKYTIFKKFKNHCPVMDEMEHQWRLLPFHHKVSKKEAIKAMLA